MQPIDNHMAGDGFAGHFLLAHYEEGLHDDDHILGDHVAGKFRFAFNR